MSTTDRELPVCANHNTEVLLHPHIDRHTNSKLHRRTCGTLNVRSIAMKVDAIKQLRVDTGTDILCLTETCHEDFDSEPIKRLRSEGLQVLERARPILLNAKLANISFVNHGGIAIVASTNIRLSKLSSRHEPPMFEHLCARVCSCVVTCVVLLRLEPRKSAGFQGPVENTNLSIDTISADYNHWLYKHTSQPPT